MNFSEIGLGPEVLRAVEDAGYTQPTPIQEQAIPWVLQGRDVLGCELPRECAAQLSGAKDDDRGHGAIV